MRQPVCIYMDFWRCRDFERVIIDKTKRDQFIFSFYMNRSICHFITVKLTVSSHVMLNPSIFPQQPTASTTTKEYPATAFKTTMATSAPTSAGKLSLHCTFYRKNHNPFQITQFVY